MVYAADALRLVWDLQADFGRALREQALDIARRDGRDTVTAEDVGCAFDAVVEALSVDADNDGPVEEE